MRPSGCYFPFLAQHVLSRKEVESIIGWHVDRVRCIGASWFLLLRYPFLSHGFSSDFSLVRFLQFLMFSPHYATFCLQNQDNNPHANFTRLFSIRLLSLLTQHGRESRNRVEEVRLRNMEIYIAFFNGHLFVTYFRSTMVPMNPG